MHKGYIFLLKRDALINILLSDHVIPEVQEGVGSVKRSHSDIIIPYSYIDYSVLTVSKLLSKREIFDSPVLRNDGEILLLHATGYHALAGFCSQLAIG